MIQSKMDTKDIRICIDNKKLNYACVHDHCPTLFSDEGFDRVAGKESYYFTNKFSRYHKVKIVEEYINKTTFTTEWHSFASYVIPFGLNNVSIIFSRIVIVYFIYFIHKFLEVFMDNWTILNLLKKQVHLLWLVFDIC